MAYLAACTNAGTRKHVNEDACCVEAARTPLGEVLMAVVCDGVGGLAKGNVASSTVIDRFVNWFERELPALVEGMVAAGRFDFSLIKIVWGAILSAQNELIRTHGASVGARLGTTFTGIIACDGHYLIGHVGDCRVYRMNATSFEQLTEDQTLVAKRLAAGEITAEEAKRAPKNVILQAIGSQRALNPAFYEGSFASDDLFVICCDGAYHQAENEGIRKLFQALDYRDEAALSEACSTLLQYDMDCGEKDNLTAVCFSGALAGAGEVVQESMAQSAPVAKARHIEDEDDLATMVEPEESDEDDLATMVEPEGSDEDDLATMVEMEGSDEDDLATTVDDGDEDDLATMVDTGDNSDEDDLATMVEPEGPDEDDLATMVEMEEEDDLATMVDAGDDSDEDDLATMVEPEEDEDDLATQVADEDDGWDEDEDEEDEPARASDLEDEAPTMVVDDDIDDDDLPTMVEGADA